MMSDSPASSFALGYLAAGPMVETASLGTQMLTQALLSRRQPTVDVNSLFAAIRELEAHIGRQDAFIEDLKRETRELREHARDVERDRNALIDWAERAEAELKRWRTGR